MLHRGRDGDAGGENKLAALTADLREERAARLKAERALDEATLLISSLKTKLKHAEMALEEGLSREGEARAQGDALLVTEREARQQAEARAAEAALALSMLERKVEAAARPTPVPPLSAEPLSVEPATAPSPDLFGAEETSASPAAPKRRVSKKTTVLPAPTPVKAAPKPPRAATPGPERSPDSARESARESDGDGEDKPIEWWLPSFRAARKIPIRRKRPAI
jgi:hypothetical protein